MGGGGLRTKPARKSAIEKNSSRSLRPRPAPLSTAPARPAQHGPPRPAGHESAPPHVFSWDTRDVRAPTASQRNPHDST